MRQYKIQVRGYDLLGFITDARNRPDPLVDVIVPVKADSIATARTKAVAKVKRILKKGWPADEFALLGNFETRKAINV